jgi:hypothetical protein
VFSVAFSIIEVILVTLTTSRSRVRWPTYRRIAVCRHVPAVEVRELEDGVDGGFERAGVALNLGEEEAALECGEEGDGEVVRVGAVREVPGGVKTAQSVADGGRPLPESGRDQVAGLRVGLGQRPGERASRAGSRPGPGCSSPRR